MQWTAHQRESQLHTADQQELADERAVGARSAELLVSQDAETSELRHLLGSLGAEDCAHSWRNISTDATVEGLLRAENSLRPTELFFFYLRQTERSSLIAAAAIAERVTREFPNPGICVLGRCYVLPEFRGQGHYRRILHYRLNYCRMKYGSALDAVHIGTDNPRIANVVTDHRLVGWPNFIHLGQQRLEVAGESHHVAAYLLLMPAFVERLRCELDGEKAPRAVESLARLLRQAPPSGLQWLASIAKDALDEGLQAGFFRKDEPPQALQKILSFCRAVPLTGFERA